MSAIGPPSWKWFDTDTLSVPSFGIWGDVKRFEEAAKPHGLYVAWSGVFDCFVIYTIAPGGRFVLQDIRQNQNTGEPRPLDYAYLSWLIKTWELFGRMSVKTIALLREQAKRDERARLRKEDEDWTDDTRTESRRGWQLRTHRRSPAVMVLPKGSVRTTHGK